jgi:hypothetical protein
LYFISLMITACDISQDMSIKNYNILKDETDSYYPHTFSILSESGQLSVYSDSLWAGRSVDLIPVGKRFSALV